LMFRRLARQAVAIEPAPKVRSWACGFYVRPIKAFHDALGEFSGLAVAGDLEQASI
jgi:hypothetical protein